jgi:hypothetical protein
MTRHIGEETWTREKGRAYRWASWPLPVRRLMGPPKAVFRRLMGPPFRSMKGPPAKESQTWGTFIRNHLSGTLAIDFFTVPTVTFDILYVFVVLSLERRLILHVNVTTHPYAEWAAQQIVEAFGADGGFKLLIRDRDSCASRHVRLGKTASPNGTPSLANYQSKLSASRGRSTCPLGARAA